MLGTRRHPDYYQGFNKERNYFEVWYFKIIDRTSQYVYAIIPGIIRGMNDHDHESFLQILDGVNQTTTYISYGVDSFKAKRDQFLFSVGSNEFSLKYIKLNHYDHKYQILGELKFVDVVTWPDSKLNPGSMGYYNFLPLNWHKQVCCLYGEIVGKLLINNTEIDFSGGKVYIEKMWGKSFPKDYIWVQSSDFSHPNVSFTCRVARIPILGITRKIHFAALYIGDEVYKFTSNQRSKIKIEQMYNQLKLVFTHHDLELTVSATFKREDFIDWRGPQKGQLVLPLRHALTGQIRLELIDLFKNKILYSGIGENAGIEVKGKINPQKEKDYE